MTILTFSLFLKEKIETTKIDDVLRLLHHQAERETTVTLRKLFLSVFGYKMSYTSPIGIV